MSLFIKDGNTLRLNNRPAAMWFCIFQNTNREIESTKFAMQVGAHIVRSKTMNPKVLVVFDCLPVMPEQHSGICDVSMCGFLDSSLCSHGTAYSPIA